MTTAREALVEIFQAAVEAVAPERLVARHLVRDGEETFVQGAAGPATSYRGTPLVLAVGKAAARMSAAVRDLQAGDDLRGMIIVPDGPHTDCGFPVRVAGHPLPDERGESAARELAEMVRHAPESTLLVLLSGGASSLLVAPRPPATLADKIAVTRLLLAVGADIEELNTVRKHLSLLKGGGLLRLAGKKKVIALILSDVVGDDPVIIASGPTAADPTSFADAARILCHYDLGSRLPASVKQLLKDGTAGRIEETLDPRELDRYDVTNIVIGSNAIALAAAATRARALGYAVTVDDRPLCGDTTVAARDWAACAVANLPAASCRLAGGETTVTVRGSGRGGRNQEFALAIAPMLAQRDVAVLSAGTDGIDGPTDAAGAFVDGTTVARARALGLDAAEALLANDSFGFFEQLGDLFRCGPTGTNVMDVKIALGPVARPTASG